MRRRLLCVYQHAPTPGAPGIYRHRLLFAELVRRGWHVDLVSTPRNYMTGELDEAYRGRLFAGETIDGIRHHWVWASGGIHASKLRRTANYLTFATASLLRAAALRRPDVVLVSSPPITVGLLGPLLAVRHRAPWLLEVRDIWPESAAAVGWLHPDSRLYRIVDREARRLARGAAGVVVPTPGLVAPVRAHGARRVEVVPGLVEDLRIDAAERAQARAALGVPDGRRLFVYAGALGVANGLDTLVDAVGALPAGLDFEVVVAGDGSARSSLEARIARDARGRIRSVGAVGKDGVRRLLAASDVCLHLLRDDPVFASAQPTKMLEYFGAARPVVTTATGRPEELARAAGGGHATSAPELAAELQRFIELTDEELARRGATALAYGLDQFGLGASTDRLERLLSETVSR